MTTLFEPPAATVPRVVGLDLSLAATGLASPTGQACIRTQASTPLPERLLIIRETILGPVDAWPADLVVIEDLPRHVAHGGPELGMVHGVVRTALHEHGAPVLLVPPATLKTYATGKGNAGKDDIRAELIKRLGLDIREPNERDAWVLWAIGMKLLGHPVVDMPAAHCKPLAKLTLPALRGAA